MISLKSGKLKAVAAKPSYDEALMILGTAQGLGDNGHLWSRCWTFAAGAWFVWLCENGYLKQHGDDGTPDFYGFSSADLAPDFRLTEKGKDFLLAHGHGARLPLEVAA